MSAPGRIEKLDRMAQNRSLGWPAAHALPEDAEADIHLHPMRPDLYLCMLAMQFEELGPRLAEMRAEMRARPEEYGERYFDLDLWEDCGPGQDELGERAYDVEWGLAAFIFWAGSDGRDEDYCARRDALCGFQLRSRRSLAAFAVWARNPWFCDLRGNDFGGLSS